MAADYYLVLEMVWRQANYMIYASNGDFPQT